MKKKMPCSTDHFPVVVEYYRVYAERNKTFEEFADDVNTLGGTLELGATHIDTTKTHATVSDRNFNSFARYSLKDIWNTVRVGQMSLF